MFVDLPAGLGVAAIAARLAAAGVIPDPWTFRIAARVTGSDRRLQAGEYRFADAASPRDVIARLVAGDVYTRPVTFPEGLTIVEMADIFGRSGLGTSDEFLVAAADTSLAAAFDPEARSLEGYLFPDTYAWSRHERAAGAVRAMVARFDHAFDAGLRAEADARGMTLREVLTLASIIEKETARADERPVVSAVYHNRLKAGMPLQCDPTVIYALMLARRWDGNIRKADLEINSPYNTYRGARTATDADRLTGPRVDRRRDPSGRRPVSVLRQPERRHARVRDDAGRAQSQRAAMAGERRAIEGWRAVDEGKRLGPPVIYLLHAAAGPVDRRPAG